MRTVQHGIRPDGFARRSPCAAFPDLDVLHERQSGARGPAARSQQRSRHDPRTRPESVLQGEHSLRGRRRRCAPHSGHRLRLRAQRDPSGRGSGRPVRDAERFRGRIRRGAACPCFSLSTLLLAVNHRGIPGHWSLTNLGDYFVYTVVREERLSSLTASKLTTVLSQLAERCAEANLACDALEDEQGPVAAASPVPRVTQAASPAHSSPLMTEFQKGAGNAAGKLLVRWAFRLLFGVSP